MPTSEDASDVNVDRTSVLHSDYVIYDPLCGLMVRVLGYRSGGPGSIPGNTRKKK
jgi:hypothetical protein